MEQLVKLDESNHVITTSKMVADSFGKEHRQILDKVRKLLESQPEFGGANFCASFYASSQNKALPSFEMTRDGFTMIAMSLTGAKADAWKIKYINAFNRMEAQLIARPATMAALNELTRKIESDEHSASVCGQSLAKYKAIKKENEEEFQQLVDAAQLSLGFKVGVKA